MVDRRDAGRLASAQQRRSPPRPGGVPPRDGEAEGASVMRVIGPA